MKFEDLSKDELINIAEQYAVDDVKATMKKEVIIAKIRENGVGESLVEENLNLVKERQEEERHSVVEDVKEDDSPTVLMRMTRKNPTFEVLGYKFTKEHPFRPVSEKDVDKIMDLWEGFRPASPKEAADFYG